MPNYEMPDGSANDPKKDTFNEATAIEKTESPEHIPSIEEVRELFEKFIGENKFVELRKLEDEKGLYLWEIRISAEDGSTEYEYIRKGNYKKRGLPGGSSSSTAINKTDFDLAGIPCGGQSVAKLIDGKWLLTT